MTKNLSRSHKLASEVVFAGMNILVENGGELPSKEVMSLVMQKAKLDDWALVSSQI